MEPLLSLSFSNISSRDASKIRKGLRQIEGLLAQICLSAGPKGIERRASIYHLHDSTKSKRLLDLGNDLAFCEFFRLQDGFECNVPTHLITCLERLLSMPPNSTNDSLLLSALNLLQGMLLLHPPSRALFSREIYMNLLLDLLPPSLPPAIQSATLTVLIIVLTNNPTNARVFERADGLLAASALLREPETTKAVKQTVLEFLYFYLLPEEHSQDWHTDTNTMKKIHKSGSGGSDKSSSAGSKGSEWADASISELNERSVLRTVKEKQKMLGKYLSNVAGLKQEFKAMKMFEGAVG